jgi:two-component system response regulator BaeR
MSVLIINHDAVFLRQLQNAFETQGFKVIATTNSLQTIQLFSQHKPQVVILNICMPNKDGFEITKEIRAFCQRTFILAMSENYLYLRMIKKLGASEVALTWISPAQIVNAIGVQTKPLSMCMACCLIHACKLANL